MIIVVAIVAKFTTMGKEFSLSAYEAGTFDSLAFARARRPTRHGYTDPIHRAAKRAHRDEKRARYPSINVQG